MASMGWAGGSSQE